MELNKIYNEDCLKTMKKMPDNFVDLVVTSPPYNKGYWSSNRNKKNGFGTKSRRIEYDNFNDCMSPKKYNEWQREVIKECLRVLKNTGSLFYNHQPIQKLHQEIFPTYVFDFPLKQTIIWNRMNTPKLDNSYFFPTIEYIFWIQKNKESKVKFNRKESIFNKAIWSFNPDINNPFPAPFPIQLPLNCILSCTDKNDIVYDTFMGSGTTAIACIKTQRNYLGSEIGNCDIINKRIEYEKAQLKLFY